jgi:hypothetical protein
MPTVEATRQLRIVLEKAHAASDQSESVSENRMKSIKMFHTFAWCIVFRTCRQISISDFSRVLLSFPLLQRCYLNVG